MFACFVEQGFCYPGTYSFAPQDAKKNAAVKHIEGELPLFSLYVCVCLYALVSLIPGLRSGLT